MTSSVVKDHPEDDGNDQAGDYFRSVRHYLDSIGDMLYNHMIELWQEHFFTGFILVES
jgi:hypothetical protein